ncbi:hypothetical protein BASA81_012732 [Batrachochytrium salamandrivorans]|nr:hypothetical protein BASA81_012732 [Batrachochytrium salamandrivorans]
MYAAIPPLPLARVPSSSLARVERFGVCTKLVGAIFLLGLGLIALVFPISHLASLLRHEIFPNPHDLPLAQGNETATFLLDISIKQFAFPKYGKECKINLYCYGESLPGPVIYLVPGEVFAIQVTNRLSSIPLKDQQPVLENQYHSANSTAVHFHGLHISPETVDNVFEPLPPNTTRFIRGKLLDSHPSGTYFAHPHLHGSSALQGGFAMASPLVVLDTHPDWRAMQEQILLLQILGLDTHHAYSDARLAFTENHAAQQSNKSTCNHTSQGFALINGHTASMQLACDWQARRWRIINAASDGALVLQWKPASPACLLFEIARDGLYLAHKRQFSARDTLLVPTGGRVDFVVEGEGCNKAKLLSAPESAPSWLGNKTNLFPPIVLVECHDLKSPAQAMPRKLPNLPGFMKSMIRHPVRQRRVMQWTEFPKDNPGGRYGINGEPFTALRPQFSVRLGHVEEWTIHNEYEEAHPFHIHTNHFQVVRDSLNTLREGPWFIATFYSTRIWA